MILQHANLGQRWQISSNWMPKTAYPQWQNLIHTSWVPLHRISVAQATMASPTRMCLALAITIWLQHLPVQ